jgi:radical SAM superfamily enzyme YgiQ (UPF0313 family)
VPALLLSTYDLGRQPFGLASAAAALEAAGVEPVCLDLARQPLDERLVAACDLVAFFLPMHTATRLALPVIERVRRLNPSARLCAFGLYAPLNAPLLRERGVRHIAGGEFEEALVAFARGGDEAPRAAGGEVPRVQFRVPIRAALPSLDRYATLQVGAERRIAGYTEASRGCKHRCRHCPIVPVYDGRFRIVPVPIVIADIRTQVEAGARHVTFGDPDFFNGVRHATDLLRALAAEFPGITYDVTIKVEHLLRHAALLPLLRQTGCLFVTTAVESVDDGVLAKLEKGHTRRDFEEALSLCRAAGVTLSPTFVPFTPWTTLPGYCDLLQTIERLDLIAHVSPIQLAIRLLVPEGSRLLELDDLRRIVRPYSAASLTYPWHHPQPEVDRLQRRIERLVGTSLGGDRREVFDRIWQEAHAQAGITPRPRERGALPRAAIPYLNEPWYC